MRYDEFLGVNLQEAPHLLREGELSDMRNLRADTKELEKRPGIEPLRTLDFGNAFNFLPTAIFDMPIPYRPSTDARSAIGHQSVEWGVISSVHTLNPNALADVPDYEWDNWPDLNRPEPLNADTVVIDVSTSLPTVVQGSLFTLTLTAIRGGVAWTGFGGGSAVTLENTFLETNDVNAIEHDVLLPIDLTIGWVNGVWSQPVVIDSVNLYDRLWIGALYDSNYGQMVRMKVTH